MSTFKDFFLILIRHLPRNVIPGSFTIVYKKTKRQCNFLILKAKPSGNVTFPGGSIAWKENFKDAAKRELYEETGLKAKDLVELPIIHKFKYKNLFLRPRSEQHVFVYEIQGKQKTNLRSIETEWFKWVDSVKAAELLTHKELSKTFKKSLKYIK